MKIENSIKTTPASPVGEALASSARPGQRSAEIATQNEPGNTGDSVKLSMQLQSIEKNLATGEVFDAARVAEIKQAISEGRFVVNAGKVADGLLETVRDLIRTRQG
ncbi:flagellar biosynthesis anti-sigma factor FlgM [Nitrosovibrio sp. Nv4]|uniref:flagellar biosynthesis anti-sigma factor FlgM n=1 Tax=Nitrosovibrio sp. Nv4 TaxID=1945880 RepID=UPI000BDC1C5D|nr:flagellar biosynthesis anti-sigma factor FlgM [Nitrosovibrio sp. Nv4]SOD41552.1 anti-sigma-28 factor, FlgM family [Nitrosovibrio sp. Nv4]